MNRTLFLIALLGGGAAISFFLAWPAFQELGSVQVDVKAKGSELASRENYYASIQSFSEGLQARSDRVAKLQVALPDDSNLPSLYELMDQLASESGTVLRSVSISPPVATSSGRVKAIAIGLNMEGSYGAMKEFLNRTKRASRVLTVESMEFAPQENGRFAFHVAISAYSY